MALEHSSFALTDNELQRINDYIAAQAEGYAREGEDAAQQVSVIFDFVVPYGRSISVKFNSAVEPTLVVDFPYF